MNHAGSEARPRLRALSMGKVGYRLRGVADVPPDVRVEPLWERGRYEDAMARGRQRHHVDVLGPPQSCYTTALLSRSPRAGSSNMDVARWRPLVKPRTRMECLAFLSWFLLAGVGAGLARFVSIATAWASRLLAALRVAAACVPFIALVGLVVLVQIGWAAVLRAITRCATSASSSAPNGPWLSALEVRR
jgi:hypothetical protein